MAHSPLVESANGEQALRSRARREVAPSPGDGDVAATRDRDSISIEARGATHASALLDLSADAIILTSASGTIRSANASTMRLLGYPVASLVGRPILDFTDHRDARVAEARKARPRAGALTGKMRMRRADGTAVEVEMTGVTFRDASGRLFAYHLLHDLTESLEANAIVHELRRRCASMQATVQATVDAKLQHGQRLQTLGVLAGGIAHDFNNLLVGILGNASLARADVDGESDMHELLGDVERAALRAAGLTRQLLAFSAPGERHEQLLDLSASVREVAQLLLTAISARATLTLDLASALPAVRADSTQLVQLVMNLITNASDALDGANGTITLTTGAAEVEATTLRTPYLDYEPAAGRYVYVEVRDSGKGMTADTRQRLFDPFFSTKGSGRGLGLAATLGIVRSHRGSIVVDSAPEKGTSFRIYLPAVTTAAGRAEPLAATTPPAHVGRGLVLVADDDAGVGTVARQMLERRGYQVQVACTAFDAIERFYRAEGAFGLALIDQHMPSIGGAELALALRSLDDRLPIIMMSGCAPDELASRLPSGPIDAYIQKPFRLEELDQVLARVTQPTGGDADARAGHHEESSADESDSDSDSDSETSSASPPNATLPLATDLLLSVARAPHA